MKQDLFPGSGIPTEIQELLAPHEQVIYLERPSEFVLYARLAQYCAGGAISGFACLFAGDLSLTTRLGLLSLIIITLVLLPAYLCYLDWANRIYAITTTRIIIRWGFLDRRIRIAPTQNIQMLSINTGIIDRWLKLNSVYFFTAANAGYWPANGAAILFRWIESKKVIRAFGASQLSCTSEPGQNALHSP